MCSRSRHAIHYICWPHRCHRFHRSRYQVVHVAFAQELAFQVQSLSIKREALRSPDVHILSLRSLRAGILKFNRDLRRD